MEQLGANFLWAFAFSFVGSIPPGTLNLTIIQLGLDHKMPAAWRFAFAAALIEYPYAYLAVRFEKVITASPGVTESIQLFAALFMIVLAVFNLLAAEKALPGVKKYRDSGFRRGLLLSLLNPMALPFWIAVTAYLTSVNVIRLVDEASVHAYLAGVSIGGFALLIALAYAAKKISLGLQKNFLVRKMPSIILLAAGLYGLYEYFF